MEIEITVKLDSKRSVKFSLDEARELAEKLGAIVKETQYVPTIPPLY